MSSDRALEGCEWGEALLEEYKIPSNLRPGLERYIKDGIRPGGFLSAVLINDLRGAVLRAHDAATFNAIRTILQFLLTEVSDQAHGSIEKVEAWIERRRAFV